MSWGESRLGSHPRPDSSFGQAYTLPWGPLCVPCMDLGYARPHAHHAPRPPGYATQKATPLRERAATGPLRNPSQHSSSLGRQDPSLAPDSGGPIETRRRNDSDGRGRGSGAVTYERAREEAGVRPWPQDGKRWCRRGKVGSRCTHQGPIRGAERSSCPHAPRRAPPRWDRPPAPCSQREGRCMQPGRSQGNQMPGRWTGA